MKCSICKNKIETTFLDKIKGTFIVNDKKMKPVCSECQKKFSNDELTTKLE